MTQLPRITNHHVFAATSDGWRPVTLAPRTPPRTVAMSGAGAWALTPVAVRSQNWQATAALQMTAGMHEIFRRDDASWPVSVAFVAGASGWIIGGLWTSALAGTFGWLLGERLRPGRITGSRALPIV